MTGAGDVVRVTRAISVAERPGVGWITKTIDLDRELEFTVPEHARITHDAATWHAANVARAVKCPRCAEGDCPQQITLYPLTHSVVFVHDHRGDQ